MYQGLKFLMSRRHRNQRIKPQLNVYRESRSTEQIQAELRACAAALEEQRLLRKHRVKESVPENCKVPETGLVAGGWRHEAKLLRLAAKRSKI
jgi:hypothetical protein